jgi:membrane protease YdiL (CAAX protease family)
MSVNLTAERPEQARAAFPYSNWGPAGAVFGALSAIVVGLLLGIPALFFTGSDGDLTTAGNVIAQAATVLGLLLVPVAVARWYGADSLSKALRRLGVRRTDFSTALKGMALALGSYLAIIMLYSALVLEPEQEDIADGFGPIPVQVLLIVFGAAIAEEVCFRGLLFAGLRERLPRLPAALIAGSVFGALHAFTGISAVPPLIAFGFIFCLLYEKTGSILPGMALHMLNNSVALLAQ